jgi:RNA polymerase sigma factor (sigma-70 family)
MLVMDDIELLREYALRNSEEAFATLVTRHIDLVYAAAWRQVGNHHHAEEITQAVFVILARKARSLGPGTVLPAWLFRTARLTAANHLRTEARRARREQEAFMQSNPSDAPDPLWEQMAPVLNDVIDGLRDKDRNAIVLRFLQGKDYKQVAAALGATEEAAQMRVNRVLEKMRKLFGKKGIVVTASILGGVLAANGVQAAPASLTTSVAAAAVHSATLSASTLTLTETTLKIMAWTKTKFAIGAGVVALLAFQYHQNSAQARQLVDAKADLESKNQTFAAQKIKIAELDQQTASILEVRRSQEQELTKLRARREKRGDAAKGASEKTVTTLMAATLEDPAALEEFRAGMVDNFRNRWRPLIKTLNLDSEQADKLFRIGGEWGMKNMATLVEFTEGRMTAEAAVEAEIENKSNRTNEIRLLLGDEGFAEYQKCNASYPARELVKRFDKQLGAFPMSANQREQLSALIQAEPFELARKVAGDFTVESLVYPDKFEERFAQIDEVNKRIMRSAVAFLNPEQLHEWELMQTYNFSLQKWNMLRLLRKL